MEDKIYTIDDIIEYNLCPRRYKLKNIMGFDCGKGKFKTQVDEYYQNHAFESIKKSIYYFFKKLQKDEEVTSELFKKQFGNIYYKNLSAMDIIGMETRSPSELEPIFTKSLGSALDTFLTLNRTKWKPLIVDKPVDAKVGKYTISGKLDAVVENKNRTSSIEIMTFSKSKNQKSMDEMYVKNNFHLNFGRHVLRTLLDAEENRISIIYPYKAARQVVSKPDKECYQRFLEITEHTCEDIEREYFPAFVNKFKCDSCAYKAICDTYTERA